jgi:hypothetical protein
MNRKIFILLLFIGISAQVKSQVKLYEDQFHGGVTGGSFSTGVSGTGSGVILLHIDPAATIRKAYLIVGRLGPAAAFTVNLNAMVLTFDATNQATPDFNCPLYGGLSAVHAIDITSQVSPAVNTYNISYNQVSSGQNLFTDFYMYVAYEKNSLPLVNTVVFLKTTDYIATEQYTLTLANPIDTLVPVGFAMHGGYMCDAGGDGENISVGGTLLGDIGGGDPNNPLSLCSGTSGSFYYESNTLYGLNGDSADQAMIASDALSDVKNILPNHADTFDVQFEHFGGPSASPDNSMWAWVMAYGFSNLQPTAIFNSPNHICPGTCTEFTNLSFNATSFVWSFPGANPSVSVDVNPTGICYSSPGQYDVQLIAINANGSDTLLLHNYITVFPAPPAQGILQNGDTLFANPGAVLYQWYFNGNIINGASSYFYVAPQSGNYSVVATDENGCEVEAVINNVIASSQLVTGNSQLVIFPNPVNDILEIRNLNLVSKVSIALYNTLGKAVPLPTAHCQLQICSLDVSLLPSGVYILEIISGDKLFHSSFIKK